MYITKRIKLWYYKRLLRDTYHNMQGCLKYMDCGVSLARKISPQYAFYEKELDRLFNICKKLEGEVA